MKQLIRMAVLAGAALAVAGCATQPSTVYQDTMYLPQLPSLLVQHTPVSPPPDQATYLAASSQQQKTLWLQAWQLQTQNVMTCNIDKDNVGVWYSQQAALIAKGNAASAPVAASGAQAKQ